MYITIQNTYTVLFIYFLVHCDMFICTVVIYNYMNVFYLCKYRSLPCNLTFVLYRGPIIFLLGGYIFSLYWKKVWRYKGVIRSRKSKDRLYNDQEKKTKGQTMIWKTLHRKLKIEQHEPPRKTERRVNSGINDLWLLVYVRCKQLYLKKKTRVLCIL